MAEETNVQDVVAQYLASENPSEGGPAPAPEPTPATDTPAPDYESLLNTKMDEVRGEFTKREDTYKETIEKQGQAINKLETLVGGAYTQAHPVAPAPEPEITEADLAKDPMGTLNRVSDARVKKAITEYDTGMSQVLRNVVERGYQGEMKGVATKKYFKYAQSELEDMFVKNPALKMQANSVEMAYRLLVGTNIEDYETKYVADNPKSAPAGDNVPTPAPPVPSGQAPGAGPPAPVKAEPELTANQKALVGKFAAMGIALENKDFQGD